MKKNSMFKKGQIVTSTSLETGEEEYIGWVKNYDNKRHLLVLSTFAGIKVVFLSDVNIKFHPVLTFLNKIFMFFSNAYRAIKKKEDA